MIALHTALILYPAYTIIFLSAAATNAMLTHVQLLIFPSYF